MILRCFALALILGLLAAPALAALCAADDVPAATLLFPYLTGSYAATATAQNPVADRTQARSLFTITNISSTPRIVHLVLHNDMGFPLLGWDVVLNGYQSVTHDFANVMEGKLQATGGASAITPIGIPPPAIGPVPAHFPNIPDLPKPGAVGRVVGAEDTVFGRCTDPSVTPAGPLSIDRLGQPIPDYFRANLFLGLGKSQVASENGWWLPIPPDFEAPLWLLNLRRSEPIRAYLTADVVAACGGTGGYDGSDYFDRFARPVTASYYANDEATGLIVGLGNTLLGNWMIRDDAGSRLETGSAVALEVDNQDVPNLDSPAIPPGRSFYRQGGPGCAPGQLPGEPAGCEDIYTGTGIGPDFARGSPLHYGNYNGPPPITDFREPLPSAFAFRWYSGSTDVMTKLRVFRESSDIVFSDGYLSTDTRVAFSYYSFDDAGRVVVYTCDCPISPCDCDPSDPWNHFPLAVQELQVNYLILPITILPSGWCVLAFSGSNGRLLPIPGGYDDPALSTADAQAWVEVVYETLAGVTSVQPAQILGNFLCDGRAIAADPRNGRDRTDLGNVRY